MDTADLAVIALAIVVGAAAAALWWRSRTKAAVPQRHFRVWSMNSSVLQSAEAAPFSAERFAAGMGAVLDEVTVRQLAMANNAVATIITVPERCCSRVPFAAAGCGLMAQEWSGSNPPAVPPAPGHDPTTAVAQPLPGLLLGLSTTGRPVSVYPVPGATVVFTGEKSIIQAVLSTLSTLHWPDSTVRVTSAQGWQDAWDSAAMRVVVTPDPGVLATEVVTATVTLQASSAGLSTVSAGDVELHFTEQSRAMNPRFWS